MKHVTFTSIDKTRIITTILYTHFRRPDGNNDMGLRKELLVKTDIIDNTVKFIVIYNHFEESYDNIIDAVICYNKYN